MLLWMQQEQHSDLALRHISYTDVQRRSSQPELRKFTTLRKRESYLISSQTQQRSLRMRTAGYAV